MATQHPIAFCPLHGIFPVTGFGILRGVDVIIHNSATDCPQCGRLVGMISGTYRAEIDRINLLIDPNIPLVALGAIRKLAERASAGEITIQDAKREAEKIHPKAGRLFDISNWSDTAKATLYVAIITAVGAIASARISSSSSHPTGFSPIVIEQTINNINESPRAKNPRPGRPRKKHRSKPR